MTRILVLYGTSDGQTTKVARAIARRLNDDRLAVDVVQAADFDPSPVGYDGVIVAGSVRAGTYPKPIGEWLRAHVAELANRPTAFVSVCLSILSKQAKEQDEAREIPRRFADRFGWHPAVIKVVAGALPYTKYNFLTRWIMKRIVSKAGGDTDTSRDYEYTDWTDVGEFAREFGHRVAAAA